MLAQYINVGDVDGACEVINDPSTKEISVSVVTNHPDQTDQTRLIAEILTIKKGKTKKLPRESNKFSKMDRPYDRLLLLR